MEQIGHLDPYARVEGETFAAQSGIETELCSEGGVNVTDMQAGNWIKITVFDFGEAGASQVTLRTANESEECEIELRLDSLDGQVVANCRIPSTGGGQKWQTATCDVNGATGVHALYLRCLGGAGNLVNLDWWQFTPKNLGLACQCLHREVGSGIAFQRIAIWLF